ncbi:MAG: hypothetical protein Athens101410_12 [Parcubacteria group bacterium Athens1014_10]|nr:MAG: hypothetical protein Athens101410_12 [Parcubacteria group bacterium Athens1014_10]TSD06038.1 MAG: hypothetical protein Athens071412_12 [Parcubacteria group bacterium Athens0714_12]
MLIKKICIFIAILVLSPLSFIFAADFNPNYIISDAELTDYNSLSLDSIQKFLEIKDGTLKNYKAEDIDGKTRGGAEIIYNASRNYKINPQILLVLLQKEQSLIDNSNPTQYNYDWATGFARCDDCDLNDPVIVKFKGFAKQIDGAASRLRWYLAQYANNENGWLKQAGATYDILQTYQTPPSYKITIANQATACLYNYTPYYHGNYSFWKLWNKWFTKIYPDGTLLQAKGEPGVWLVQFGKKRPFLSRSALFSSYDTSKIIRVEKVDLERYESGRAIKFAQYSLLRSPAGTVYLLINNEKRGFRTREAFRTFGYNPEEIIDLSWEELADFPEGEPITIASTYPTGALLQNKSTGAVFYVQNGVKNGIIDRSILKINFKNKKIIPVAPEELDKYAALPPIKIKDGELVKSTGQPAVYIISNSEKRPITSPDAFNGLGYKWENINNVPQGVLDLHLAGEPLDIAR